MKKYNIPTAKYEKFDDSKEAIQYLKNHNKYPIVIKADGLAFGKGVIISNNFNEAQKAVYDMLENDKFNESVKTQLKLNFKELLIQWKF